MLARMRYPELPEAVGVLRAVERPTYDGELVRQLTDAMAGTVDVVNRDPGAEFRISLPAV